MNKLFITLSILSILAFSSITANASPINMNGNIKIITYSQSKEMGLTKVNSITIRDNQNFSSLMEKIDIYLMKNNAEYYSVSVFSLGNKDNFLAGVTIYK
jgi:hypothetical protein